MGRVRSHRRPKAARRACRPRLEGLEPRLALTASAAGASAELLGDGTLLVQGTPGPDRIRAFAIGRAGGIGVVADGRLLGRFVGVRSIRIEGGDGDDAIAVGSVRGIGAVLDGGGGDDRLRGGSSPDQLIGDGGDDVLIGAGGFDSLRGGLGRNAVASYGPMGAIAVSPSASGDALRLFQRSYTLKPIRGATSGPIVVGPKDLSDAAVVARLKSAYDAGRPVGLTLADQAAADLLQSELGHPQSANIPAADPDADLVVFRRDVRPDGGTSYTSAVLLEPTPAARASRPLAKIVADQRATAWLSQIFAADEAPASPPPAVTQLAGAGDSPSNALKQLADSYFQSSLATGGKGDQLLIDNTIWSVRSFTNHNDYYYVAQEVEATTGSDVMDNPLAMVRNDLHGTSTAPTLIDPSPRTTPRSTTYTHGVSWSIGGSVGYNQTQGFNGALSGGVSISDSSSYTVPGLVVVFSADLAKGEAQWYYLSDQVPTYSTLVLDNDWIWVVPQSAYAAGETKVQIHADGFLTDYVYYLSTQQPLVQDQLDYEIPTPFGDVYELQNPVVDGTDAPSVDSGANFIINGSGFYPSLVESIELGGRSYSSDQFTVLSDTQIQMTAPDQPGQNRIVVQTQVGRSNSDQSINIT